MDYDDYIDEGYEGEALYHEPHWLPGELERREMEDELGGLYGDPRRCPRHPHVKTSSDDGMYDAPCHVCEGEMEDAYQAEQWAAKSPEERHAVDALNAAYDAARGELFANLPIDDLPF